jgi:hypothetical protein
VPRTQNRSKTSIRYCGACGYELSPGHEGPCPMCPRFNQLRADFTMPRPSELSVLPRGAGGTTGGLDSERWPPTPSEYREILAERRRRLSTDAGKSASPGVIRTPGLVRAHTPGSWPESQHSAPEPDAIAAVPAQSEKKTKRKSRDRRAGRKRARPLDDANLMLPVGPGPSPQGADTAADALREQPSDTGPVALAEPEHPLAPPWPPSHAAPRIVPMGQHSRSVRVAWWRIAAFALIIIVMSVLTGAAVSFMLPSP